MNSRDLHGNVLGQRFDGTVDQAVAASVRAFYVELVSAHPAAGDTGQPHGPQPPFGRVLTPARRAQGFASQVQLDAFYAHFDHCRGCEDCGPGPAVELDDGLQPTMRECPAAVELYRASIAEALR